MKFYLFLGLGILVLVIVLVRKILIRARIRKTIKKELSAFILLLEDILKLPFDEKIKNWRNTSLAFLKHFISKKKVCFKQRYCYLADDKRRRYAKRLQSYSKLLFLVLDILVFDEERVFLPYVVMRKVSYIFDDKYNDEDAILAVLNCSHDIPVESKEIFIGNYLQFLVEELEKIRNQL